MDILIEESQGNLWAVALGADGRLEGLEVDPVHEEVRWGSVYCARVKTVDKALDAVFVDLDGDNTGILYNQDVRILQKDGSYKKGGDVAIGKILSAGDFVVVQAKSAYLPVDPDQPGHGENKIPQMSMDVSIPGRYLIYCATMGENRLSLRIRDKGLRSQLTDMMSVLSGEHGYILRVAAANTQTEMLRREAKILKSAWMEIQHIVENKEVGLIMLGPDAVQRVLSDHADKPIEVIEVVTMDHYNHTEEWCSVFAPDLVPKILPIEIENAEEDLALFYHRDIMGQIESLFGSYAFLPCGGNIILQNTAALLAVDVNKGAAQVAHLTLNLEAGKEALRQIRLRNEGGVIFIDFVKCRNAKERKEVLKMLDDEAAKDPCTVQIHGFTGTGMVEISRKRRTPTLSERVKTTDF